MQVFRKSIRWSSVVSGIAATTLVVGCSGAELESRSHFFDHQAAINCCGDVIDSVCIPGATCPVVIIPSAGALNDAIALIRL